MDKERITEKTAEDITKKYGIIFKYKEVCKILNISPSKLDTLKKDGVEAPRSFQFDKSGQHYYFNWDVADYLVRRRNK